MGREAHGLAAGRLRAFMDGLSALLLKKWNLKITSQLATLTIPLIGAISLFIFVYFPAQLERQALKALEGKANQAASVLASKVSESVTAGQRVNLEKELADVGLGEEISYAVILDASGHVVAATGRDLAEGASYLRTSARTPVSADGSIYRVSVPAGPPERHGGRVYLGLSLKELREQERVLRRSTAAISIAIFIFGMVVMFTISTIVIKPLNRMVQTFREIAEGNLNKRVRVTSQDEVGNLARSFNTMVDNLQAAYQELEQANRSLEERVAQRTWSLEQEIRERRTAEEALKTSEKKYRTLFEELIDGVLIHTPEGVLVDANPAAVTMLGYESRADLMSVTMEDLFADRDEAARLADILEREGLVNGFELSLRKGEEGIAVVSLSANTIRDGFGRIVSYRSIVRDITGIRQLEHQLIESQKLETVGRLAGGVAHDFNNMLNIILGNAQLARMAARKKGDVSSHILSIEEAVRRAAAIVKQLLAYGRRQVLDLKVVCFNDVVSDFAKMIHRFVGENIEMRLRSGRKVPRVKVDTTQVNQVLLNLVVNARDAMPDGGELTIETRSETIDEAYCRLNVDARPGRYAVLTVSDTGTGIDEETAKQIFEPFFTTKGLGQGTGLGLSVVYGIVRQHGGFINVYSEPGKGTVFKVYFPAVAEAVRAMETVEEPMKGGSETILIAEDEPSLREVASAMLTALGYQTVLASDGEEAVHIFREKHDEIDLVLLDVVMPRLGGKEAYEEMKKIKPSMNSLFVTGYSLSGIHTNFILEQGIDALQKPYSAELLGKKVREILDRPCAA